MDKYNHYLAMDNVPEEPKLLKLNSYLRYKSSSSRFEVTNKSVVIRFYIDLNGYVYP